MNTKQLEYFLVLCRTRNISTASDELFLTRQALSKSIQALEREVGAQLFIRTSTGVELTEAGTAIRDASHQCMLMWNHTCDSIGSRLSGHVVRLGAHLMHMSDEAIEFMTAFEGRASDVRIKLYGDEDYTHLFDQLRENRLDVAIARRHPEGEDLRWARLMDNVVYVMVNENNPLAAHISLDFGRDLRGCVCFVVSLDTMRELTPYANEAGIVLEYMTPNSVALGVALNHDRGLFFAPDLFAPMIAGHKIVARRLTSFPLDVAAYCVHHPNPSPPVFEYIQYLQDGFPSLPIHNLDQSGINAFRRDSSRQCK